MKYKIELVNKYIRLIDEIYIYKQPTGNIIYDHREGDIMGQINDTALNFISYFDGTKTYNQIVSELSIFYNIDKFNIENDLRDLIKSLKDAVLLLEKPESRKDNIIIEHTEGKTSLIKANIELTEACNLKCRFCCNASGKPLKNELDFSNWIKAFSILKNKGVKGILLSGGEVFTHPNVWEILEFLTEHFSVVILSNGYYLNNLSEYQKDIISKVKKIQISIDSAEPKKHNWLRGENSWEHAVEAVKLLKSLGVRVDISSILFPDTTNDEIEQMIELTKEIGADNIIFAPLEKKGRAKDTPIDWEFYERVTSFMYSKAIEEDVIHPPSWEIKRACLFTSGMITIRPNGYLKPCLQPDEVFEFWDKRLLTTNTVFDLETRDLEDTLVYKLLQNPRYPSSYSICKGCPLYNNYCPSGCIIGPYFMELKGLCTRNLLYI